MRQNPELVKKALAKRGIDSSSIDQLLDCDVQRRALTQQIEQFQYERNQASKKIGEMLKLGQSVEEISASVDRKSVV